MKILGIETTCDETACSVVENGKNILSNVIFSQDIHIEYGGVVPFLASKEHLKKIKHIAKESLEKACLSIKDIDAVAVSYGPGLHGSISIGLSFAEGLALSSRKKIIYVNHIKAHLYAAFMSSNDEIEFPCLGIVISGGHSSIVIMNSFEEYQLLGESIDDAIGEAFDKVAKMLDLPYPGGPEVEKLASEGEFKFKYTICKAPQGDLYFSNSGLKTQVMYMVKEAKKNGTFNDQFKKDICRSFQETVFKDIFKKILKAYKKTNIKNIVLGGGVINSQSLRKYLELNIDKHKLDISLHYPTGNLSLDNGAMIAGLAFQLRNSNLEKKDIETRTKW